MRWRTWSNAAVSICYFRPWIEASVAPDEQAADISEALQDAINRGSSLEQVYKALYPPGTCEEPASPPIADNGS